MAVQQDVSILDLEDLVEALPHVAHERFGRLFHVSSTHGRIVPPEAMNRSPRPDARTSTTGDERTWLSMPAV